jgi:hypothetical protein
MDEAISNTNGNQGNGKVVPAEMVDRIEGEKWRGGVAQAREGTVRAWSTDQRQKGPK